MSHQYKKIPPPARPYSPAKAVREHGDQWRLSSHARIRCIATDLALGVSTHDQKDAAIMSLCERGIVGRVS